MVIGEIESGCRTGQVTLMEGGMMTQDEMRLRSDGWWNQDQKKWEASSRVGERSAVRDRVTDVGSY